MKNICYPMGGVEYSTDEKVVGKWIDSKPIYQKTTYISENISAQGRVFAPLGVSNIDKAINYWGVRESQVVSTIDCFSVQDSGVTSTWTSGVFNPTTMIYAIYNQYHNNPNTAEIRNYATSAVVWTGYITVQYTKTTD